MSNTRKMVDIVSREAEQAKKLIEEKMFSDLYTNDKISDAEKRTVEQELSMMVHVLGDIHALIPNEMIFREMKQRLAIAFSGEYTEEVHYYLVCKEILNSHVNPLKVALLKIPYLDGRDKLWRSIMVMDILLKKIIKDYERMAGGDIYMTPIGDSEQLEDSDFDLEGGLLPD